MADSRSVYLFVEDEEQLDKALEVSARLPLLRKIIVFDMEGLHRFSDPLVISFDELPRSAPSITWRILSCGRRGCGVARPDDLRS